jgi:hypothetical protein
MIGTLAGRDTSIVAPYALARRALEAAACVARCAIDAEVASEQREAG